MFHTSPGTLLRAMHVFPQREMETTFITHALVGTTSNTEGSAGEPMGTAFLLATRRWF